MQRSDKVQFVLAGGEKRFHYPHRHLHIYLGCLRPVLLEDMNEEGAVLLGDADIRIFALDGNELAVLGTADGVRKRPQINAMAVYVVEPDLAAVQAILIDGGENLFGELQWDVHAYCFVLGAGVADADMQPAVLAGRGSRLVGAASRRGLGSGGWRKERHASQ